VIRCPRCGTDRTFLHGYAAGNYPASYKCENDHAFREDDVDKETAREMRAGGEASREQSRANAAKLRGST
jgi:hypothetical protein